MRVIVTLALALFLVGCTEVKESLVLDAKGGGTYALTLRWNADVWRRVGEHIPKDGRKKLVAHPFPMTEAAWRDGLEGIDGVTVTSLEARDRDGGWRELRCELAFTSLEALFRWEVIARRGAKLVVDEPKDDGADRIARLTMEPIAFVPVLDPVAALLDAVENPPPRAEGLRAHKDLPPLRRLGLEKATAQELWAFVGPQVARSKLTFDVTIEGRITEIGGEPVMERTDEASFTFDFAALRNPETDRTLRIAWRVPTTDDPPPAFENRGERRDAVVARTPR